MQATQPFLNRRRIRRTLREISACQPNCIHAGRYLLTLSETPELIIFDQATSTAMRRFDAEILRYLVTSGALPRHYHRAGTYTCNKDLVWHLFLAAAAAQMSFTQLSR